MDTLRQQCMNNTIDQFIKSRTLKHEVCRVTVKQLWGAFKQSLPLDQQRHWNRTTFLNELGRQYSVELDLGGRQTVCGLGLLAAANHLSQAI
jgi:hypothetical protein